MNIIFGSGGNDSVALVQWAIEKGLQDLHVAYSNTGWAADFWEERLDKFISLVESNGGKYHEIQSEGMVSLVTRKKGWPRNGMAFCSYELKIKPAMQWLETIDPEKEATCLVGIRREESARRAQWPEWVEESENHGGRSLYAPLVRYSVRERDELIVRAGFDVLPHRSMECYPCVNASKADIAMLDAKRIDYIEAVEISLGVGERSGKKKTMFRPGSKKGATGIREVWQWAQTSNFVAGQADIFCDSGFCGS
jgi:3'-phosphoadenosine 5'-phosphosulfate sulfotransferase (PAPS reductase)/FAD synthetase